MSQGVMFGSFCPLSVLCSWVGLLYKGASCMVKVQGGLSHPIPVGRGIWQGCPISSQLYYFAIEQLLHCRRLCGLYLPGALQGSQITVSPCADDINVIVRTL